MAKRSTTYLSISKGKIALNLAGSDERADPLLFEDEGKAAETLAECMLRTDLTTVLHSSSCNFPDEYGRPDFDLEAFYGRVREALPAANERLKAGGA